MNLVLTGCERKIIKKIFKLVWKLKTYILLKGIKVTPKSQIAKVICLAVTNKCQIYGNNLYGLVCDQIRITQLISDV